jgi:AraC-like DNA-binding protein
MPSRSSAPIHRCARSAAREKSGASSPGCATPLVQHWVSLAHAEALRLARPWRSDDKLEAIAPQVGYSSGLVLARAFARCIGMSPTEYRQRR